MRVLVTGAGGQVGHELVELLEGDGRHQVLGLAHGQLDVTDRDAVAGAITGWRPDAVVHSAAWTAVDACEADPDRAFLVNALGTRYVADAARRVGAHVTYLSTDYVFDGRLDRPYTEWDFTNPASVYGRSKLGGEHELDPGATIVRTSWVFGRVGANMVKTVLRLAETHDVLSFVDDQRGKPTSADDLARVVRDLTVSGQPGTFHVTNGGATTWFDFAADVVELAGLDRGRVRPIATSALDPPRPAPRPANSVLDDVALRASGIALLPDHREPLARLVKELVNQ